VSYRLEVRGGGDKGTIAAAGRLEFFPLEGKTLVRYSGDYHVSGPIAGVGQRLFHPVAQLLTGQFFRCIERRVGLDTAS
jgi:carbon monoxide dehydrogenase subunit G